MVFAPLQKTSKASKENCVLLSDEKLHKGTLCAIVGDNLQQLIKSSNFCRSCEIDCQTFHSVQLTNALTRTLKSYKKNLKDLDAGVAESAVCVKCNTLFNDLNIFTFASHGYLSALAQPF